MQSSNIIVNLVMLRKTVAGMNDELIDFARLATTLSEKLFELPADQLTARNQKTENTLQKLSGISDELEQCLNASPGTANLGDGEKRLLVINEFFNFTVTANLLVCELVNFWGQHLPEDSCNSFRLSQNRFTNENQLFLCGENYPADSLYLIEGLGELTGNILRAELIFQPLFAKHQVNAKHDWLYEHIYPEKDYLSVVADPTPSLLESYLDHHEELVKNPEEIRQIIINLNHYLRFAREINELLTSFNDKLDDIVFYNGYGKKSRRKQYY